MWHITIRCAQCGEGDIFGLIQEISSLLMLGEWINNLYENVNCECGVEYEVIIE